MDGANTSISISIFCKNLFEHGNLKIQHICSEDNIADIFTKPLTETLFKKFASHIVKDM